jgi:hypothetical protein
MQSTLIFYDESKSFSKEQLKQSLDTYMNYRQNCMKQGVRLPNFPEHISENLVKFMIMNHNPNTDVCWAKDINVSGDLFSNTEQRIEVKCFSSDGPITFGPNEPWDNIYFLDARDCVNGNYTCYRVGLKSTSDVISNLRINSKQTFGHHCKSNRRPRLSWKLLKEQIPSSFMRIIFKGHVKRIIN